MIFWHASKALHLKTKSLIMTTFYKYRSLIIAIQRNTKYNPCHTTDKKLKIIVERPITGDNVEKVI